MLTLLISKSDQQKQEMSNKKQIEVQNYIMFSVKLLRTLESSVTKSEKVYDTSLLFETSPLYWKDCSAPNIPVTTPGLIIARPMSCFGIRRGWPYGHLRRCQSGCSSHVASPWTSLRKPISSIVPNLRNPSPFRHLLMNCNIAFSFQVEACFRLKFVSSE